MHDATRAWIQRGLGDIGSAEPSLSSNNIDPVTPSSYSSSSASALDDPATPSTSTAKRLKLSFSDQELYGSLMIDKDALVAKCGLVLDAIGQRVSDVIWMRSGLSVQKHPERPEVVSFWTSQKKPELALLQSVTSPLHQSPQP